MQEIILPKLGVSMEEGTLLLWHKKEGDQVRIGEDIFLVETEKTTIEVQSNYDGTLFRIIEPEGAILRAGQVVGLLASPGEEITKEHLDSLVAKISSKDSRVTAPVETAKSAGILKKPMPREMLITPSARRLIREYSLDPNLLVGTGERGLITAADVESVIQQSSSSPLKVKTVTNLTGRRLVISRRLGQIGAVEVTLMNDANAAELLELKSEFRSNASGISITELLIPMVCGALKKNPSLNSIFENNQVKLIDDINIGIAVDTPEGLVVPVIKNADRLSVDQLTRKVRELERKARSGQLTQDEVTSGTFTITNLGMFGVQEFTPVLNPPQCAILGVGAIEDKPIVKHGKIEIGPIMKLNLTFDHRVMDGVTAAKFLLSLKGIIEDRNG